MPTPQIPEIELFAVFKWLIVLLIGAAAAQLAALYVKRWFYGSEKHDRRTDTLETRGWIERFLEGQAQYTAAIVGLRDEMRNILKALQDNGKTIEDFTERSQCKYEHHGGKR